MKGLERRALLATVAMLMAVGAAMALRPHADSSVPDSAALHQSLPATIDEWRALSARPVTAGAASAEGAASIALEYGSPDMIQHAYARADGQVMVLTIRRGGRLNDALQARRPEALYSEQGFEVSRLMRDRLRLDGRTVPVTRVEVLRDGRSASATYWTLVNGQVVRSRTEWLMAQLQVGLTGRIPEGVQVQVTGIRLEPGEGFEGQDRFIAALMARMPEQATQQLIGS